MEVTHIYLVRHSQSQGNLHDLFLGHTDLDLTELGYEQAGLAADYLAMRHMDAIYSSDLSRAFHTAQVIAQRKHLPVITDPELREIYAGQWEHQPYYDLKTNWPEAFRVWDTDFGNSYCPGGENVQAFQARVTGAVERIAKKHPGESVCIVSHAAAIRVISAAWLGLTPEELQNHPWPSNTSVTHGVYKDGRFALAEYSRDDFIGAKRTAFD